MGIGGLGSLSAAVPQKPKVAAPKKFGALAVDRVSGFIYGFAYDQTSQEAAEARAREEVASRNGNGDVVLVWSGTGCGAYRTQTPDQGNAYGWGVAPTRGEAEAIADREAMKRTKGKPAPNNVWGCNEAPAGPFKVIKNDIAFNFRSAVIDGKVWTADNVSIDRFRNGDPIPLSPNFDAFWKASTQKKAASYCFSVDPKCEKFGRVYNGYAVNDQRGFAPPGWRVPSNDDYLSMINPRGGKGALPSLRSSEGWPEYADPIQSPSGFDALAGGSVASKDVRFGSAFFWTSNVFPDGEFGAVNFNAYDTADEVWVDRNNGYHSRSVRLIRD